MTPSSLDGNWLYRSFVNNPQPVNGDPTKALDLIFGEGALSISVSNDNTVSAVLDFGGGDAMDLKGSLTAGAAVAPAVLIMTGNGRHGTGTAGWVYKYQGYVVPAWPHGVNQVPAIVGTVIRAVPHNGGAAGLVASFVILKQPTT